ncbi:MAG: hypothetical protein HFG14_09160 [Lachnospiraceae bacterium]|jgi:hypothetical protein|nr:hypothetical protein [Lachnospiraceae bacterium]
MSAGTKEVAKLMEIMPESELNFALELTRKQVQARDTDFKKLTMREKAELTEAQKEIENGESVSHKDINWE